MYPSKTRKTKCAYCNVEIKCENLKSHCNNVHQKSRLAVGETKVSTYFSAVEKQNDYNPSKKARVDTTCEDENIPTESLIKLDELSVAYSAKNEETFITMKDVMNELLSIHKLLDTTKTEGQNQLTEISDKVDNISLNISKSRNKDEHKTTVDDAFIVRVKSLFSCRSVQDILDNFCEITYNGTTQFFVCKTCTEGTRKSPSTNVTGGRFFYNSKSGLSFSSKEKLPMEFVHLKAHLKDHLSSSLHIQNWKDVRALEEQNKTIEARNIQIGMRIGRICYSIYQEGQSKRYFEKEIVKAVKNGTDLGDLNHSKNFVEKFRPYVSKEVNKRTKAFLNTRLLQTGYRPPLNIQADKGTNVHRTRQFMSVITVIPDSDSLLGCIYMGQPVVKAHDGHNVAVSIADGLKRFDIASDQIEGGSFDGQYFHLSVNSELKELFNLPDTFVCTTDPLHRCGTVDTHIRKDESFRWMVKTQEICTDIYSKFNWGKNYELLVETCKEMDMKMKALANFHTVRFANSVRLVFVNIREDFQAIVSCLRDIHRHSCNGHAQDREKAADASRILNIIVNKKFCLFLSGIADIYDVFGILVNICQKVDILPYERYDEFNNVLRVMEIMAETLTDHFQCLSRISTNTSDDLSSEIKKAKCFWPRYHSDVKNLNETQKYAGVDITQNADITVHHTRLATNEERVDQMRSPFQIANESLRGLVVRMHDGLKKEVFNEDTKSLIKDIRLITDLKGLCNQILDRGPIIIGHQNAQTYLEAVKRLTSLDGIPDIEIMENFRKFCKTLSEYVREKNIDVLSSSAIIKDFLRSSLNLFDGVELSIHIVCVGAVKLSVESVVESIISKYETHFNKSRQMTEEHALEELEISENGPCFVKADPVLRAAMNRYWGDHKDGGQWHFLRTSSDRIKLYQGNEGKTVSKLMKAKSKFPYQDLP